MVDKIEAVDFLGEDLEVGQRVVFMPPYRKSMAWGTVKRITPQTVRITYGMANKECNRTQKEVIILSEEQLGLLAAMRLSGRK